MNIDSQIYHDTARAIGIIVMGLRVSRAVAPCSKTTRVNTTHIRAISITSVDGMDNS